MKIKTSELIGRSLDYAVAIALGGTDLGFDTVATWWIIIDGKDRALSRGWSAAQNFSPSTDWNQGGPIIEQEDMKITRWDDYPNWTAHHPLDPNRFSLRGDTPLIAAMRCYVASKLGDEVEVPDELIKDRT